MSIEGGAKVDGELGVEEVDIEEGLEEEAEEDPVIATSAVQVIKNSGQIIMRGPCKP